MNSFEHNERTLSGYLRWRDAREPEWQSIKCFDVIVRVDAPCHNSRERASAKRKSRNPNCVGNLRRSCHAWTNHLTATCSVRIKDGVQS